MQIVGTYATKRIYVETGARRTPKPVRLNDGKIKVIGKNGVRFTK